MPLLWHTSKSTTTFTLRSSLGDDAYPTRVRWEDVAAVVLGGVVVAVVAVDLPSPPVVTWGSVGRWRPTRWFYRLTWWGWSGIGRRVRHVDRQQRFLAVY